MANPGRPFRWIGIVPNVLSSLRLVLAVWFPFSPDKWWLTIIVVGGVSDLLDGYIARRFNVTSKGGGLLDGIADKFFVLSVLATLTYQGHLAIWQVLLVLVRDLTIGIIAADTTRRRKWSDFGRLKPSTYGKVTTLGQYVLMVTILLWPSGRDLALVLAISLSLVTAGDYLSQYLRELKTQAERRQAAA